MTKHIKRKIVDWKIKTIWIMYCDLQMLDIAVSGIGNYISGYTF